MHREESGAKPGHAFDALRDGVGDVVQLEVDKDLLAGAGQRVRVRKPAGEGELIADLVERDRVAEPRHQRGRRFDRGDIERNDQALARL